MKPNNNTIHWGIIGTGGIANKFASAFPFAAQNVTGTNEPLPELVGVASRDLEKAKLFAQKYNIPKSFGSYTEIIESVDVDIVYVGLVNSAHYPVVKQALLAGKPVLCEKPFTLNPDQTEKLIQIARAQKIFLMEGIWTRTFPIIQRIKKLILSGDVGRVLMTQMDFGFTGKTDPAGRLYNPTLGGGALLDVGIYPITTACLFAGRITDFQVLANQSDTGVDTSLVLTARHDSGAISALSASIQATTDRTATIATEHALIHIPCPFWKPSHATIIYHKNATGSMPQSDVQEWDMPYLSNGFEYEINHVSACLANGLTESPLMTLEETLQTSILLNNIRNQFKFSN